MKVALVKNYDGLDWFGDMPEAFAGNEAQAECHWLEEENRIPIARDFAWHTNGITDRCLDIYDVDYYDVDNCTKVANWLERRLNGEWGPCSDTLRKDYELILSLARRALNLGTGIVIEL